MRESSRIPTQIMHVSSDSLNVSILPQEDNQVTGFWNRLKKIENRWKNCIYPKFPKEDNSGSTREESNETIGETLRRRIYTIENCDLHEILLPAGNVTWTEWHLLIDKSDKTLEITKNFQNSFKNITESSSIVNQVKIIEEIYSQFPLDDELWRKIEEALKNARVHDDPKYVVIAYTYNKEFTKRLNAHLATNAYHFIKLYCTILNCPTLHLTKDYVDAFTYILCHPKLKIYQVKNDTVYRGTTLDDRKPIENFKPGATILTTTYLSTSKDPNVAEIYSSIDSNSSTKISLFCTYILNNSHSCSALDISEISNFAGEKEVLLLRYVPFKIKTMKEIEENRRINICFEQYSEILDSSPQLSNNLNSIPMHLIEPGSGMVADSVDISDGTNTNCCPDEENHGNIISRCE